MQIDEQQVMTCPCELKSIEISYIDGNQASKDREELCCQRCLERECQIQDHQVKQLIRNRNIYTKMLTEAQKPDNLKHSVNNYLTAAQSLSIEDSGLSNSSLEEELCSLEASYATLQSQGQALTGQLLSTQSQFSQLFTQSCDLEQELVLILKEQQQRILQSRQLQQEYAALKSQNVLSMMFNIWFDNHKTYLNNESVTHSNMWKTLPIMEFFIMNYKKYDKLIDIDLEEMMLYDQNGDQLPIATESRASTLKWMPLLLREIHRFSQFFLTSYFPSSGYSLPYKIEGRMINGLQLTDNEKQYQEIVYYLFFNLKNLIQLQYYVAERVGTHK